MIESLPGWINFLFVIAAIVTLVFFYFANGKPKVLTGVLVLWASLQSGLAYSGFYQDMQASLPRFALVLIPSVIVFAYSFLPRPRAWMLRHRKTEISTFSHVVRLPVEIALFQLFLYQMVPELMTFEGRNFDIIAGITAPLIGFLYMTHKIGKKGLLTWNIFGFFLVSWILFNGILSAELPFQQFGFEQPNKAVTFFPFILLPAVIVPIVLWTHMTDIVKLMGEIK